jgi:hypothetical protein
MLAVIGTFESIQIGSQQYHRIRAGIYRKVTRDTARERGESTLYQGIMKGKTNRRGKNG